MDSIVDTAEFANLDPEFRGILRGIEVECVKAIEESLAQSPLIGPAMLPVLSRLPGRFLLSHLPLYRMVNDLFIVGRLGARSAARSGGIN